MPRRYQRSRSVPQFGFPATRSVSFKYVSSVQMTIPTAATQYIIFSANSINDPLQLPTTGGHRPAGYNQWEPFYAQYLVVGSSCTATVTGVAGSGGNEPLLFAIDLVDRYGDPSVPLLERLETSPYIAWTFVPGAAPYVEPRTVCTSFSARKFFNRQDIRDNWSDIGADFGADPVEQAYYRVMWGDNANTAQAGNWECIIEIKYHCILAEPIQLTVSDAPTVAIDDFVSGDPDTPDEDVRPAEVKFVFPPT